MTIWGWDASHYDAVPAGSRVVSEGFSFMTHKAGGDANDAELGAWWTALQPVRGRVLLGAYWVLIGSNGAAEADELLARLDAQCPGWRDGPFILQLDCEKWGSTPAPTKATIKACADRLRAKCPKLMPILYAPKWVYGNGLDGLAYPLWASSYVGGAGAASTLYPGDSSSRWDAYSGQVPAILQFTSSATIAGQTTCDANAFRGTLAQLTALLAPGWDTDMLTDDDLHKLFYTDGLIPAPANADSAETNPYWTLRGALQDTGTKLREIEATLADHGAKLDQIIAALGQPGPSA